MTAALFAAPVVAQDAAPGDAQILASLDAQSGPSAEPDQSGDIVVTARRRDENAQDVPIALSVVGAETLETTGNFTLGQVQHLVPSLQVFSFNPRNTNINIRGLGSNVALTNDGLENGVGVYIDNVYYGRVGQSQFDLVDLQQIEVLRGPQGTLFGKNTTAGAINISSRPPSFEREFSGEATIGDLGYHQVRASVSAPLIADVLAFRLSAADTHKDGFVRNVRTNTDSQSYDNVTVRGQLLAKPAEALTIKLIADYSKQTAECCINVLPGIFPNYDSGTKIPNNFADRVARAGYTPLPFDAFARQTDADSHYQANMEGYGVSGQADLDLGGHALTSITAYRWWDWNPANDADSVGLPVITLAQQANRQRQFSQEVRLASSGARTVDYVIGVYYFWQIIRGYGATAYGSAAANWNLPTVPAVVGNAALNGFRADSTSNPETKSYAAFGQATWNVSEALKLTAGLRFTHETKRGEFHQWQVAGVDLSTLPPAQAAAAQGIRNHFNPVVDYATERSDDSLSGLVTLSYALSPDILTYATYSRGSKSGGLNLTALPAGVDPNVRPETVNNYEAGVKAQFADRTVTANAAVFWTDVSDYQTGITEQIQIVDPPSTVTRQYIANIPSVRSRGIEGDLAWQPSKWIGLSASAAYADAIYREYRNAPQAPERLDQGGIQDLSGEPLAGVPKFTYTLGADVAQPLALRGREVALYGHADFSHRSSYFTSATNSRFALVPGYGLLNARIGVRDEERAWDLSVWARNLTDKDYFQTLGVANTGLITGLVGEPRTFGVTLRTKL